MPKKVDEYFKEIKENNPDYDDSKAWATAWSIYCKHVNNDSKHCQRPESGYFKKKKKKKSKKKSELEVWLNKVAQDTMSMLDKG